MIVLNFLVRSCAALALCLIRNPAQAATFSLVHIFSSFTNSSDIGEGPTQLVIAPDEKLYGLTVGDSQDGYGTVYTADIASGVITYLHAFKIGNGTYPVGLTLHNAELFGTAPTGGAESVGTIFKLTTAGTGFSVVHSFANVPDGAQPTGPVIYHLGQLLGSDVRQGSPTYGEGVLFSVVPKRKAFTALYTFGGVRKGPADPSGDMAVGTDGTVFGASYGGGTKNDGTIFAFDPKSAATTVLYSFLGDVDGANPAFGITLSNGVIYGTTEYGGSSHSGTVYAFNLSTGVFTTLYTFSGGMDGAHPVGHLGVREGVVYGTTLGGGKGGHGGDGTVFQLDTVHGAFATLHEFDGSDGSTPGAGVVLAADGTIFGTTMNDGGTGIGGAGVLFKIIP